MPMLERMGNGGHADYQTNRVTIVKLNPSCGLRCHEADFFVINPCLVRPISGLPLYFVFFDQRK